MIHPRIARLAAAVLSACSAPAFAEPSDNPFVGMAKVFLSVTGTPETCVAVALAAGTPMAVDAYGVLELESLQSKKARCIARGGVATGGLETGERAPAGFSATLETYATGTITRYLRRGEEFIGRQRIFDASRPFCAFAPHDGFREALGALALSSLDCGDGRPRPDRIYGVILLLRGRDDRGAPSIVPADAHSVGMAIFTTDPGGGLRQVE